jgi:hypothetical protein
MGRIFFCLYAAAFVVLLLTQTRCGTPVREEKGATPSSRDRGAEINSVKPEGLELKLISDTSGLHSGQCANLRLNVFNSSDSAVQWSGGWIFEQQGQTPPLPEAFPRNDLKIPPRARVEVANIRLCHADLSPGTYNYRVSTAPATAAPASSNQFTLQVLP